MQVIIRIPLQLKHHAKMRAQERQKDIYTKGIAGIKPSIPLDFPSLESAAQKKMSQAAFGYVKTGAGRETTIANNRSAFDRYNIVPRMLQDVSVRDTSVTLFGQRLASPFVLSPIGVLDLAKTNGDILTAKACESMGIPMVYSNQASSPMEAMSEFMPTTPKWFQLYYSKSKALAKSLATRAENCGCQAIVVTLDTTLLGWRLRDLNNAYLPFLEGRGIGQYTSDPVFQSLLDEYVEPPSPKPKISAQVLKTVWRLAKNYPGSTFKNLFDKRPLHAVKLFISIYSNPGLSWEDIVELRSWTNLPILLKGILHKEDAIMAKSIGVDGLFVSNHGGRQVDGALASLEALAQIREAVGDEYPLILDSGIRNGQDVFKALSLGATAVGLGRPYVYALAINGQQGVEDMLSNYCADFELTMALSGCKNIREINKSCLL